METTNKLLSPDEVAARIQIPKATLYAWRHRGLGPNAIRVGRHLRYPAADLDAWLEQQRTLGGAA